MKRSPSSSPSPSSLMLQSATPSPTKKPKTDCSTPKLTQKTKGTNGEFTGEKYAIFLERFMTLGWATADRDKLAAELGVTKRKLVSQMEPDRSNIRKRVLDWVKGL